MMVQAEKELMVIIAGDSGVYVGFAIGGARALGADGRIELTDARHLHDYYVAGRVGDGGASDLAALGIDPNGSSVSKPVPGVSVLVGVRRAFDVSLAAAKTFARVP